MNAFLNTTLDDFHLIGFSLGAHVSGHAGARLKNLSRISGLDPAGPLFESFSPSVRLDEGDAKFVDVIHTNADSLIMGGLGAFEPMGHVDFYPNGGRMQKGCANLFVGGFSDILWPTEGDGRYLCNHRRGYQYYLNSVAPICKFPSFVCRDYETFLQGSCFPCKSCGSMGYFSNKAEGRGQLYLVTRDTEPFCANQYKVIVKHSGGPPAEPVSTYGRIDVTFIAKDGLNETLQLTQSDDMAMEAGSETVRIMVPHPAITEIVSVQLRYLAYQGWIFSGFARWAIDKISLMDSFGKTVSFCNQGTTLVSGQVMQFNLLPGDCTVLESPVTQNINVKPFTDSSPEENETEVRQTSPLQIAPSPWVELHSNDSMPSRNVFNLIQSVSLPNLETQDSLHGAGQSSPDSTLVEFQQYLPLLHSFPANHPLPHRYGKEPGPHTVSSMPVFQGPDKDVSVSSEEPVSVIPAPNLANVPRPMTVSHMRVIPQPNRPSSVNLSINPPHFHVLTSTLPTNTQSSLIEHSSALVTTPQIPVTSEKLLLPFHPTNSEFINSTAIRIATTRNATEKDIFDSTFSPRTSSFLMAEFDGEDLTTTPLPSILQSPKPNHLHIKPVSSTTSLLPEVTTSKPVPSHPVLFGFGKSDSPEYFVDGIRSDKIPQESDPNIHYMNLLPPPPLAPMLLHSQSSLGRNIPLVNSNSLIEGEIPEKDRARSLTLDNIPSNALSSEPASVAKNKTTCGDSSSCPSISTFSSEESVPSALSTQMWPSDTISEVPFYSLNFQSHIPLSAHNIRQENPQRHFPTRADAPPRFSSSYVATYSDDAQPMALESSIRPDATSAKSFHPLPTNFKSQRSRPTSNASGRLPFVHNVHLEPNSHTRHHNTNLDSPRLPPLLLNPPPLETIIGHGRAPQPVGSSYSPESWGQSFFNREQYTQEHHNNNNKDPEYNFGSYISVSSTLPVHQDQHHRIGSQANIQQEKATLFPVSLSGGNVTRENTVGSSKASPQLHASSPFYVQILPPNFGSLPHLETFSIPRDSRKAQESLHGKRSGFTSRANRGRSLALPPPGTRGAVFRPLVLQFQDNRHERYIPLRPLPDATGVI
ncbi:hypothetical protein SK128_001891 [Halocaridina rubra]|uniref:Lipase domain-containing protein n=1 Tax=Halocaridina rubra TaxID=373956 RepID=A0AAN9A6P8_HALRR